MKFFVLVFFFVNILALERFKVGVRKYILPKLHYLQDKVKFTRSNSTQTPSEFAHEAEKMLVFDAFDQISFIYQSAETLSGLKLLNIYGSIARTLYRVPSAPKRARKPMKQRTSVYSLKFFFHSLAQLPAPSIFFWSLPVP